MSIEQLFKKDICNCGHSISEEHENGKCFFLGCSGDNYWKACDCRTVKVMPFNITVKRDANTIPQQDSKRIEERKETREETREAETTNSSFHWGKSAA